MKVIVFDLGGTLMEYKDMPLSWVDYYEAGFTSLSRKLNSPVPQSVINESVEILKAFNPRVNYREVEYSAEHIFTEVLSKWNIADDVSSCVDEFWSGLRLRTGIFPDTIPVMQKLKNKGYVIAALTDLPNGMPDRVFTKDIRDLIGHFDCYMSSETVGYRKPNPAGLFRVAREYSCKIEDLVFVGDEEKDRRTAENAGCKFLQISRTGGGDIGSLYELIEKVDRL